MRATPPIERRFTEFSSWNPENADRVNPDRGNASISLLGLVAVVTVLILSLGDLAVFLLARSKAQTAADAAALAAAAELLPGRGGGSVSEARRFAEANGATLLECVCRDRANAAVVQVAVPARFAILRAVGAERVIGRARAEVDLGGLARRGDSR